MALVSVGMPCAICRRPIGCVSSENIFATTFYGIDHPEFRVIDDAAAHRDCMANWEHRDAFVDYYNAHCCNELRVDRHGHVTYRRSLFELTTQATIAWVAMPVQLPSSGWSGVLGSSRIAVVFGAAVPIAVTSLVVLFVASHLGATWAAVALIAAWAGFAWSGRQMIRSDRS